MEKFRKFLFRRVDASSLAVFRIGFGMILFAECMRYLFVFCLECYYLKPIILFKYYGFEWVEPLPGYGLHMLFAAMAIAALGITVGYFYRACIVFFTIAFSYIFFLDQGRYLNHFYMVILFCLILSVVPANTYLALDAKRRPSISNSRIPYWPLFLLGAQVEIILIHAGLVKINADWLNLEPLRTWLAARADFPLIGELFTQDWSVAVAAYGIIALHLVGAPLLLLKRTRLIVLCIYASFHMLNHFVFVIGIFPWMTLFASLILFEPDWPKRFYQWLSSRVYILQGKLFAAADSDAETIKLTGSRAQLVIMSFVVIFLSFQILFPLRHWIYPGDVAWNEQGHQFSWRMKLRSKRGTAMFYVSTGDGRSWYVNPSEVLSRLQARHVACIPDMTLQFAHYLGKVWQARGASDVKVTVDAQCSLNGRPLQQIIDPDVNLLAQKRSLGHADWILPLTTPLPNPRLQVRTSSSTDRDAAIDDDGLSGDPGTSD